MTTDAAPEEIAGTASHRKLHFIWMVDWSYSMDGQKIQKINYAIREVVPEIRRIEDTERVKIFMSAIRFGDKAEWHIGPDPVPVSDFDWKDMDATGGVTATAQAVELLVDALHVEKVGKRNVPPVCILLSDGYCTDPEGAYQRAIDKLNKEPWGKKAVRLSIGIGRSEGDFNKEELDAFISPYLRQESNLETLHADNPATLVRYIRTVSTVATIATSRSKEATEADTTPAPVHIDKGVFETSGEDLPDLSNIDASEVF
ncbi:vWA domain-containing protein [Thioalkalivibrio sp. ALE28]|uniref:vWA domain-containing protein n=1 Tax=Thioalkalivibrio sp. ALE28 TaxID=1158179 RepID=UPI00036C031B|nr:vWA domain-containing protein [Thioalkalivibrio sp. ALE28]